VLVDEGDYLCSESSIYRTLRAAGEVRERRPQVTDPPTVKPERLAAAANTVWSWDITNSISGGAGRLGRLQTRDRAPVARQVVTVSGWLGYWLAIRASQWPSQLRGYRSPARVYITRTWAGSRWLSSRSGRSKRGAPR
jgi:hypothetical protein